MESLNEISIYLETKARIDLKDIALEYIRGLSGNREGTLLISKCEIIIRRLMSLTQDESELVRKEALLSLINVSAEEEGAECIVNQEVELFNSNKETTFVKHLLDIILNTQTKNSDPACMLLCNLVRSSDNLSKCIIQITPMLSRLLDAFTNVHYNAVGCHLNYLGPLLSNLSADETVRNWLCEHTDSSGSVAIVRIASFCHYKDSVVRRGGAAGTLRNVCFDVTRHKWLLESEVDVLPYLLLPLAGGEEYCDEEMDCLPPSLQYLPPDTQREVDPDIRILLLESLNRLCAKKPAREYLRRNGVYYILRELHKWEEDRKALLACENVVDILIRKEEEMGTEDLTRIEVPHKYVKQFQLEDDDFIKGN